MKQPKPEGPSRPARLPATSRTRSFAAKALLGIPVLLLAAACSSEPEGAQQGLSDPSPAKTTAATEMTSNGVSDAQIAPTKDSAAPKTAAPEPTTPTAMSTPDPAPKDPPTPAVPSDSAPTTEVATLGAGCFWCIEAVLEQLDGVESVVSGYTGGDLLNPTYEQICSGTTGHAEVVKVTFDPTILPYKDLLDWFWKSHDPTTLNRQGADRGTQYRSAIFVHSEAQRKIAETSKKDVQPTFSDPIVTEIKDAPTFYEAEKKHQGFYFDNTSQGYCRAVIAPKLKKLGLKY